MKFLFEEYQIHISELKSAFLADKKVSLSVARLDKIHPVVSGNKLFKLHYFLEELRLYPGKSLLTFGGAYSNHLAAAAHACRLVGNPCIGIIRGERPASLSHTLEQCIQEGMQLHFVSREEYNRKDSMDFLSGLRNIFGDCMIIPEGGFHPLGAKGASLIMNKLETKLTTHICVPVGTGTTLAGLLMGTNSSVKLVGVPVLKGMNDLEQRIEDLGAGKYLDRLSILSDYHFGGYAKKTGQLISFMNEFYTGYNIPTDFVYTGKMMFAVMDKIKTGYFPEGSNILCIHTGGLQGNGSLAPSTLVF